MCKFNPYHVPSGPDGGQFDFAPGGGSSEGISDVSDPAHTDAIKPVYPIEEGLAFLFGGQALRIAQEALALARGARAITGSVAGSRLTAHGALRAFQRNIASDEIEQAIQTARQSGNVTTQLGKYQTPQSVYKGSNGVTVIVESSGRNAGKVITSYRH